jgi:hypothetical protein
MEETQTAPRISVLIVSYDHAGALRRCLRALELSTGRNTIEIVVVDNGSQDESPGLDSEFPNITLLRLPRNFGFTKALNIAMRTAKAELFLFLDANIEVTPELAVSLADCLEKEPGAAAVCPLLVSPEQSAAPAQFYRLPGPASVSEAARAGRFAPAPTPDTGEEPVAVDFPSLHALMVRAYFLKGLRYIDERYAQSWADAEIAAQIRRAGKKIYLAPGVRAVWHDDSEFFQSLPNGTRDLLAADWALGAAVFAGKYFGSFAGLKTRLAAIFHCLGQALMFRDGSAFSRLGCLIGGQKIDGTQTSL